MTTRRDLLLLLRTRPGITVNELARSLSLSVVGVRRHLDALAAEQLVVQVAAARPPGGGVGRPPVGWRLSPTGLELFPRRYDALANDLLEDLAEEAGPETVEAVLARRTEKLVAQYEAALDGVDDPVDKVRVLAELRDQGGYVTECHPVDDGEVLLVENNCAIHRVAEKHSVVCNMELVLFRRVLGPEVEVTRESHTMAGDPVCCYRVCPRPQDG
ncbi:MAG: helix-turn-helix transcriptional regulator [Acidimicrobiia bacterium]